VSTNTRDNARRAKRLGLFTTQTVQRPTHYEWRPSPYDNNIGSLDVARQEGRRSIMHTSVKGVHVCCFFSGGIPTSQWCDAALHERHKSDKKLTSLVFFFLSLQKIRISAKSATIQAGKPTRITALEGYPDQVSIHPGNLHLFSPLFKRKK
jgi:hypothetical protein